MNAASLLIVLLANHGYWFGGQDQTISMQWAAQAPMPAADVQWDLMFGEVSLGHGQVSMPGGDSPVVIRLNVPTVRARTRLQWTYEVTEHAGGKQLADGTQPVELFAPIPWDRLHATLHGKRLLVMDDPQGLPQLLADARIDQVRIKDITQLQGEKADIVLIAANQLQDSPFALAPLASQVHAGCQALILQQNQSSKIWGYTLAHRADWAGIAWQQNHPLLDGLNDSDLNQWTASATGDSPILELPADEPALELAYWPRELPGREAVALDAVLAVKATGRGRVVFCQLPLGDMKTDPRSAMFLFNALNYLATRPQPTPPPSQRLQTQTSGPASQPALSIFGGG